MYCLPSESTKLLRGQWGRDEVDFFRPCYRGSSSVKASQICCFWGSVTRAEIAELCRLWCDPELDRFPELGPQAVRAFYNFNLQQVCQV